MKQPPISTTIPTTNTKLSPARLEAWDLIFSDKEDSDFLSIDKTNEKEKVVVKKLNPKQIDFQNST